MEHVEIVDPTLRESEQVFFGATVKYLRENDQIQTVSIVGIDEVDLQKNYISWVSPIARALLKARVGHIVYLHTPSGVEELEVLQVLYQALDI